MGTELDCSDEPALKGCSLFFGRNAVDTIDKRGGKQLATGATLNNARSDRFVQEGTVS